MAYRHGALAESNGCSPLEVLARVLDHLQSQDAAVSNEPVKEGEGWAGCGVVIARPGGEHQRQWLQVDIGAPFIEEYVADARAVVGEARAGGKDLWITTTVSGPMDTIVNTRIQDYVVTELKGIAWDDIVGFELAIPS